MLSTVVGNVVELVFIIGFVFSFSLCFRDVLSSSFLLDKQKKGKAECMH